MNKYVINFEHENKRLDIALTEIVGDMSRLEIKKLIESNKVVVNSKIEYRAGYRVSRGDVIEIMADDFNSNKIVPKKISLKIIYEDSDIIVIDKPSGLLSSIERSGQEDSVMNALAYTFQNKGKNESPRQVHRIDKNTSGILIVAKTIEGQRHYTKQFSDKLVMKKYIAITCGDIHSTYKQLLNQVFKIDTFIIANKTNDTKMKIVNSYQKSAKEAITNFRLIKQSGNKYLFELTPETGRTHQLRLHCRHIGTPIIGDHMYGGIKHKRLMLHATSLEVTGMKGERHKFTSELPREFRLS